MGSYGTVKLGYNKEDDTNYAVKILSRKKLHKKAGIFGRTPPKREGNGGCNSVNVRIRKTNLKNHSYYNYFLKMSICRC